MESQLAAEPKTAGEGAPGPFASFVRFVVCGGGVGVLSSGAVALLAGTMPWVVANAVITVVSTVLCTELHALFTFGTGGRAGWRRHWQSAGSAGVAYAVTSTAVFVLHVVQVSPGVLVEQLVYLGASGVAGLGRFVVLRVFVFAGGRDGRDGRGGRVRGELASRPAVSRARARFQSRPRPRVWSRSVVPVAVGPVSLSPMVLVAGA